MASKLSQLGFFPATVTGHTNKRDYTQLHTLDPDPYTDIIVFEDERPATRLAGLE